MRNPAPPEVGTEARVTQPFLTRQMVVGLGIFVGVLAFFLTQTRLPSVLQKFAKIGRAASGRNQATFGLFVNPDAFPDPLRWVAHGLNLWDANAIGMFFAILLGGAAVVAFSPETRLRLLLRRGGPLGAGLGGGLGLPLFMCSACSAPVSMGLYRGGAALETSLGMILGSALFNPVGILAIFLFMPPSMGIGRVAFGLLMIFLAAPRIARLGAAPPGVVAPAVVDLDALPGPATPPAGAAASWGGAARAALASWGRHTSDVAIRLVPAMLAAGFVVGLVLQVAPPQELSDLVGSGLPAILAAAAVGSLLQLPTLFEVPLVLGVLALGLGVGPATALLLTAPSAGIVTFGIVRRELGWKVPALLLLATFAGGTAAGLIVDALA